MWLVRSLGLFSNIHLLATENAWAWCLFIFFLEKDILRKFVVASLSRLLPCDYKQPPATPPIYPPPPPLSLKHRHASSHHILWDSPTFLHFCLRSYKIFHTCFKFLLGIAASDSGDYRKSSEINNGVNTLTPKTYKFSRLISEHFLEEIV